ncbi:MAG: nucleotidyltransferase domain-containing protein [Thermoplasmata archaeon]|nr:nucleotidyltransferase domain-containing protein [Thermoplasmata archaeon]
MIPEEFALPIVDFVNRLDEVPHLSAAILFGSVAKGDVHKKSDIDILLLFEMSGNPETKRESEIAHQIASEISKKRGLEHSFSFVMYNVKEIGSAEMTFLRKVVEEGIGIWMRADVAVPDKLKSHLVARKIISYSLSGLLPREKMAVHRALYGYRVVKTVGDKEYVNESPGLIEDVGEKLGPGLVMVDPKRAKDVIHVLQRHGADFESRDVWV